MNRIAVWNAMEDDATATRLVEVARAHCRLVLERGRVNTPSERRKAIRAEIEGLRAERDALLKSFEQEDVQ